MEALGGGMGARAFKDGMDGVQVHITNTSNLPIEAMEMEYPLRVVRLELVTDSGGAGKFRGGLSIRKDIQALSPLQFSAHSDRHKIPPWGLNQGHSGSKGAFILNPGKSNEKTIPSKIMGLHMKTGDLLSAQTAGGGGFGSPLKRDPNSVAKDYVQRKISLTHAETAYGVILTDKGRVDLTSTRRLRSRLLKKNKN